MKTCCALFLFLASATVGPAQELAPLGRLLEKYYPMMGENEEAVVWIYFRDKGPSAEQMLSLPAQTFVSERAVQRRQKVMKTENVADFQDLPLDRGYVSVVASVVKKVRHEVKWFNTVSAVATKGQIEELQRLAFVAEIELVARFKPIQPEPEPAAPSDLEPPPEPLINYGNSYTQNHQIKTDSVHLLGITGQGVLIGVFDAGFSNLTHPALVTRPIIARFDFQRGDTILTAHSHGQNTFSTIGGYSETNLVGPAFGASFVLARTEVDPTETPREEDNWARAIIWAESLGIDVSSTSLGYNGMDPPWPGYTWQDMNGSTTVITRAADRAAALGIVVVNSAGNGGFISEPANTLGAPSDGFNVIAAGAVTSSGTRSLFSSVGPTSDGRIKPDIMAMGTSVYVASGASSYTFTNGTSFSCPLSAGVAALVLSANPAFNLTPFQVREAMRQTASQPNNPDRLMGWGILNALKAINYSWMEHTPLTDSEDTTARTVTVTIKSRAELIPDSTLIAYGIGAFTGSALLTATGNPNEYSAQIPYLGGGTVRYYIKAKNAHVTSRLPLNAPTGFFAYNSGADVISPAITHAPLGNKSIAGWPERVRATVTDNSGVSSVWVEYSLNGQAQTPFALSPEATPDVYSDTFPLASSQVNPGDSIAYRILAVDGSNLANTSTYPPSGYIGFKLVNYLNVSEAFEPGSGGFTPTNDWQWGTPSGTSPAAHSDPKCWATNLAGSYTIGPLLSTLTTPTYAVFSDRASFSLWQWHEEQTRFDGGNVKVSVNGGPFQVVTPVGGYYVASLYGGFGNPLAGQAAFSDAAGQRWAQVSFDLTGIAATGSTVAVRFDFGADNSIQYRGWYLDDFTSDGFGIEIPTGVAGKPLPREFALEQNYPNPFNPATNIRFSIPHFVKGDEGGFVTLKVYNVLGQEVATLLNEDLKPGEYEVTWDASAFPSGIYFYKMTAGPFVQTRKLLLLK